jgi:methionine sulfoxide reductase heme-binding subunit
MSASVSRIIASKPLLWALLAVPALLIIRDSLAGSAYPGDFLHATGEWSARLIIVALMLTPLSMMFRGRAWIGWLVRRRRAFGVAAFGYAGLHLLYYLLDMETLRNILAELSALGIWTGWAAFLLLVPLALTSNEASVRALKATWKRLQRLAYPAAMLTLLHWMFVHDGVVPALINFAPLAVLEGWRVVHLARRGSLRRHHSAPIQPT